jgi:hypothetical protein
VPAQLDKARVVPLPLLVAGRRVSRTPNAVAWASGVAPTQALSM